MEWNIGFAVNENILKAIYILAGFSITTSISTSKMLLV